VAGASCAPGARPGVLHCFHDGQVIDREVFEMLHPAANAPRRPIEVPVFVSALGPKCGPPAGSVGGYRPGRGR